MRRDIKYDNLSVPQLCEFTFSLYLGVSSEFCVSNNFVVALTIMEKKENANNAMPL